jgi:hypothetical protein
MPVEGYKNKRVWQYMFMPQPCSLLDRGWDAYDRVWERQVIERLRHGQAAPKSLSVHEAIPSYHAFTAIGWEMAEEVSKNANRTNAVYLSDEAIAARQPIRELRKKAYAELLAKNELLWEQEKIRREKELQQENEAAIERARVNAEYEIERKRIVEERAALQKKRDDEWEEATRQVNIDRQNRIDTFNLKVQIYQNWVKNGERLTPEKEEFKRNLDAEWENWGRRVYLEQVRKLQLSERGS